MVHLTSCFSVHRLTECGPWLLSLGKKCVLTAFTRLPWECTIFWNTYIWYSKQPLYFLQGICLPQMCQGIHELSRNKTLLINNQIMRKDHYTLSFSHRFGWSLRKSRNETGPVTEYMNVDSSFVISNAVVICIQKKLKYIQISRVDDIICELLLEDHIFHFLLLLTG